MLSSLYHLASHPLGAWLIPQGDTPPTEPPASSLGFLPFILIGVLAWFLLIQPERKRHKERLEMLSRLAKNDKVVTSGGLIGVITKLSDTEVTLRIDDGVHVHVQRASVNLLEAKEKPAEVAEAKEKE